MRNIKNSPKVLQEIIIYDKLCLSETLPITLPISRVYQVGGEMLLTILSSLAQQEVESLSENVKMGIRMKMQRGELVGFNGCFGFDYDRETKSITVNEKEAEVVRLMYDLYLQGYGTTTIARRLTELGCKNKHGEVKWQTDTILDIIKNEKFVSSKISVLLK